MSQFGSFIPEDQFQPTQDIPFEGGYALSPDTSAMMQAGSQNMDQPVFPGLRVGMPALNRQDIRALSETPVPPATVDFPGMPSQQELDAIRARRGGFEPLPQVPQEEIRSWEANKAGMPGQTAFDALWSQVTGEEAEDQRAFAAAYQPTLEQQFPRMSQTDLLGAIEAQRETQGIVDTSWLGIPATFIKPNFDRAIQNRNLQRDLRSGRLDSKFVTDYVRDLKVGDGEAFSSQVVGALERGGLAVAGTLNTVIKDIPAAAINYVTGGEWASGTISNAMAWAEYAQSLQEERLRPNSWLGQLTLDVIETAPQFAFQLATAGAGRLASTVAGLGRVGAGRVAVGAYAVSSGGTAASGQFNESLATYRAAGMNDREAVERAFYDASIAFANTTATSALSGAVLGIGSIGSKTNRAIQRAAAATRMRAFAQGTVRGSLSESTQEFLDQLGTDFLVNLRREGMPEFEEFYKQNPDWASDVLRNALYAGLVGGIIGAPAGVTQSFRQAAEARQISEEIRTVMGSLPVDHPVQRLFEKDVLTAQEAVQALDWIGKQREKIGKITAKDIQSQRQVGAGLDYAAISDDALSNIIVAGNDGSVTAPLRGAPEGGRFAGIGFTITPAMAADELARRGLVSGQAPGAATAIGIRAMPTDADPKAVNPDDIAGWVDNNESVARAMAVQPEPISRRQMEEVYGGPFQGNNSALRARFKENLNRVVNERPDWREPGRLSASVERTRQAAAQDAVEMLTGLDGIELQRVALGLSPRQAKAVSETLVEAERESRRPTVMTLEEIARQGQDARALAMQRQREEAGMAAAAGARGEIGRGEVARRVGEREAARRATEREQRMDEVVRAGTASAAMREAQDTAVEALDRVEGVLRGDEFEQAVPMTDAMDAISVVEELARQAGIDPDTAMAPIRARATALAAVEKYARTQDLTPGMRGAMDTTRRERTGRRVADIILEARREAIDQYERDERAMVEDPNYVVSQQDAVRFLSRDPESAEDIATVIRSGSALGLQLAETRRRIESGAILAEGQEGPVVRGVEEEGAAPEAGVARAAEMRLRERIDRLRRTGSTEIPAAPTPTMAETRAAVDVALISEQEQVEKQIRDLKMEQAELRRERKELADAAHTGKRGQRTKKRKPPTEREKQVAQRLEEITAQLKELDGQVQEIAGRRGIVSEAILEPVGVKETDSFPGVTADKRLEQIVKGRREIAEMNGVGVDELQIRYEDGKTRLSPAEKRLSAFGRKLGVTVVFARGPKGLRTRGAYTSGVVFIRQSDATSPQAYFSVALHEAMHHLANTDKEYFTNLYNMLRRKAPKALRQMSTVYRAKLEAQKNLAAPRNAALQIMSETGPDAERRKTALMWLIRNDRGPDFATIRENPGATLAEMIDSYRPAEGRANAPTDTDEVRAAFADLTRRARQVNLSVRSTQEEEVANLAEMLMDTAFVSAVDEDGKIDLTRIRQIADTPRAVSLFGRLSEMITDVADAIGVAKKDRGLNEAQAAKLREFMAKPEELADAKVRRAVQQLVAKSLTHMMDMRRGKVDTEVAKANPMSDARAAEEIPAVMQSLDMPETDAEYMAAVQGGDTDKAQRMVDEAAKAAGYAYSGYHASRENFNEFLSRVEQAEARGEEFDYEGYEGGNLGRGFYFTPDIAYAKRFGTPRRFFLKIDNIVDSRNESVKERLRAIYDELVEEQGGAEQGEAYDALMDETDADGVIAEDAGGFAYGASEILIKRSNQAKLADPVTRDDDGNVIPLSRRFDVSTPDIRQSIDMPSAAEMNAERGDMVDRIDGSYRNNDANIEPGDIDDAERTIDQSLSDEDSRFGRLSRAVNDTARRLTGREVPTREDRDAIEVVKRPADISPFWKFVAAPLNIAIASKNAEVISVVEDIIDFDIRRNMLTERRNREARTRWESIPQAERNEAEFAKYMDEFHDPATIDSDPEFAGKSQAWRDALKWFKERDEARRKDIIAVKREGIRRALQRDKASRIVDKAAQYGLEWEVVRGRRNRVRIRTADGEVTVDQARDSLASTMMPDTWGRQYAHFFHWFAGEWKLTAYDADGNRTILGSAKTEAEAFERLYRHRRDNPGQYRRYQAEPNVFVNPDDVVRLSTGQKRRLESLLAQATGASRTDVDDSLRGIVGSKGAKRPFYAPLMERTGAQGFETEFMKVWELSERLHNRWVMGGEMVRTITPRIEKIRQTMPGWAKYLDETMDHTMFTRPTAVEQAVDRFVRSLPVVGRLTSPFFTRRWLGAARALNYGRQLLTVRQQVVNSFQPIQTLYPVLGEANFAKAVSFYNSPEAKEVLERHGRMSADGKFREGSEETIPGVDIGGFLTRMNESVYKQTNGGVNLSSEARNQNFAFIAMYWHATNNLNMGDAEAARYARIYGNVYTQFYYTKANLPWIVRGPVAATALQYRRFMINMTGLMVNEFQKGNYSGVGRYLGTQFILGGSQAVIGFSAFGLIRSLYLGDKEGADDLSFKMREWLKDSLGSEKAADIAMMGLPAAVGIDLSGSISVWQKPFGRTLYEKAGATFAGPTVNTLLQAYTNLTGDTVVPMNPLERGYRAFAETSPTIQQMVAAWKAFNGDNAEYDARGRLKYTLDPEDAWIKAGAFRTVDESIWRMEYERLRIIRNEVDRYSDRAATQLAVGNTAEARRILGEFNGMYPMAAMTFKDIKRRADGKRQARTMPQAERRVEVDVGTRVREIAQAEGIGE